MMWPPFEAIWPRVEEAVERELRQVLGLMNVPDCTAMKTEDSKFKGLGSARSALGRLKGGDADRHRQLQWHER